MSEYMEQHAISRLIGAPPGYVGYEQGGRLTEAVRRRPYCVVLFDEMEKAHPDVSNIFLQILDDGRLTDGQGRTVDFSNVIIVMTSNIGSHEILAMTEEGALDIEIETHVKALLKKHMRPELINRIDDTVIFHQLGKEDLAGIVEIQMANLRKRVADRDITIELSANAMKALASEGYDPQFGARPLKRVIQNRIENALATRLLTGEFTEGDAIVIDYERENFVFGTTNETTSDANRGA